MPCTNNGAGLLRIGQRGSSVNPTTTYDALDRPLVITNPDLTFIKHEYAVVLDGLGLRQTDTMIDASGNIRTLSNPGWGTTTFSYDHRDRLTSATGQLYNQSATYSPIGNLTTKTGIAYSYGANGNGTGAGPHQARVVGGQTYSYDANGNLLSGGGRSYVWNAENQPTSITSGGVTETYQYDADGNRATRTRAGVTTTYAWGAWEQVGTNAGMGQ
jgi:YD repeat-containing protein